MNQLTDLVNTILDVFILYIYISHLVILSYLYVQSYMEDHLKNKDRLEREWEAMCAYEADPCSTKVAEDSSNARKNRYADVLPCMFTFL